MSELTPLIEAQLLKQTEEALREFTQAAVNCGMSRMQAAMMLRQVADEFEAPKVLN